MKLVTESLIIKFILLPVFRSHSNIRYWLRFSGYIEKKRKQWNEIIFFYRSMEKNEDFQNQQWVCFNSM